MAREPDWVSASEIGRAEFCPKYLEHRFRTQPVSQEAKKARELGNARHDSMNRAVDKRCFIATHLYGPDHPYTEQLRRFRDRALMLRPWGRVFIAGYYRLSPTLVVCCQHLPLLDRCCRFAVDTVVKQLEDTHAD